MSKTNENGLVPKLRFPDFKDIWSPKLLSDLLDYERPDNYIVKDTNYTAVGIPVLTANKSFILGYTQDVNGVCEDIPAIIFDDFTVDKKYVDFPFKVKSSAIKILRTKGKDSLKFLFELMSLIRFEAKEHKRYYISAYQNLSVPVPKPGEQQKIAACLSSLDDVITAESQMLEALKEYKNGLLQNLLPQEGETVPKFRFKEFEDSGEWVEKRLENITSKIGDGIHTTPIYDETGEYYFINGNNLIDGRIFTDEKTKRVSEKEFIKHKKELNETTILLSINGTIGNVSFYRNEKVVLGKSACYINPSKGLSHVFLYYVLQSGRVTNYFVSELTGSTIKNLSLKSIREAGILIPSRYKEQEKIAETLSSMDDLINAQSQKVENLKYHKKGLLQGLFPDVNEIEE